MNPDAPRDELDTGRRLAGLTIEELWWGYIAFGGTQTMSAMEHQITGAAPLTDVEHDMLAHAINERFTVLGANHPLPYWQTAL
jgi:hypothetical protein